jgi:hypothetical protein
MLNVKILLRDLKMKKTMLICFIFLLSGFLLSGCNEVPSKPGISARLNLKTFNTDSSFSICVFKDKTIRTNDLWNNGFDFNSYIGKNISTLTTAIDIWLTAKDIEFYEYSTEDMEFYNSSHVIHLKQDKSFLFYEDYMNSDGTFIVENRLRPFLVLSGKKICYMGSFSEPMASSFMGIPPDLPRIESYNIAGGKNNVFRISNVGFHTEHELVKALKYDNIYFNRTDSTD